MSDLEARLRIPGTRLSVVPGGRWICQPVPPEVSEIHLGGLGSFLLHVPSGVSLNLRTVRDRDVSSAADLEDDFARYADISWPGSPRRVSRWTHGALQGITGVFESAMPGSIVREWMLTDGQSVANAATFATARLWNEMLRDCEALVRSIRFEPG